MEELITRQKSVNQFFVHNCFGNFYRGVLDWFADDFYERFQYKLLGSYDKSVQFFNDKKQLGDHLHTNFLPSITLDPNFDFSPDERTGRFLWQYLTLSPGFGHRMWPNIDLKEQDLSLTPCFTRYSGTFEVIFWLSSVYELLDFRTMLLQFCGGYGRYIRPKYFWSYIILPDEIEQFKDHKNIPIDWGNTDTTIIHIDTINKKKRAIPIPLDFMWKLDSLNDNSTKYGGDQIAEYKMGATFTFEGNLPTYMVLNTGLNATIVLGFSLGKVYTKYPLAAPYKILKEAGKLDSNVNTYLHKSLAFYRINPKQKDENIPAVKFLDRALIYPKKDDFIKWCPITKGKLKYINSNTINSDIEKGDIICMDVYSEDYITYIRRCGSVICKEGRIESPLLGKCELLKKPLISDLSFDEFESVKGLVNEDVTLDVLDRKLYLGLLEIEECQPGEVSGLGFEQLKKIQNEDPELYKKSLDNLPFFDKAFREHIAYSYLEQLKRHMITDNADGIETNYPLKFHVTDDLKHLVKIYLNDNIVKNDVDYILDTENDIVRFIEAPEEGTKIYSSLQIMPIRDVVLVATYDFKKEDLDKKSDETIDISIDYRFPYEQKGLTVYDIILVSYGGVLIYDKDYEIDFVNKIVKVKIDAKEDESVLIYQAAIFEGH